MELTKFGHASVALERDGRRLVLDPGVFTDASALVRLVFDWVGVVSTSPAPAWTSRVRSVSWSITEPVIAPVRRVLRPVRVGGVSIDLAFTAVLVGVLVLRTIVTAVF
jgi:YggT family protein